MRARSGPLKYIFRHSPTLRTTLDSTTCRGGGGAFMRMTGLRELQVTGRKAAYSNSYQKPSFSRSARWCSSPASIRNSELGTFLETQLSLKTLKTSRKPLPPGHCGLSALPPEALQTLVYEDFRIVNPNLRVLRFILAGRPVRELCLDGHHVPVDDFLDLMVLPSIQRVRLRSRNIEAITQIAHSRPTRAVTGEPGAARPRQHERKHRASHARARRSRARPR
jgi:hypothetical protein